MTTDHHIDQMENIPFIPENSISSSTPKVLGWLRAYFYF